MYKVNPNLSQRRKIDNILKELEELLVNEDALLSKIHESLRDDGEQVLGTELWGELDIYLHKPDI